MSTHSFFIACHSADVRLASKSVKAACVHHLRNIQWQRETGRIYLSLFPSRSPPLELPKTDEKPISSSRNQANVTKNAFNGRRRAAQHRRSFRCRVIKSQFLVELLLIMRHRNASSFYDRFRERTHTSPRINDRLCRYVLLRATRAWELKYRCLIVNSTVVKFR